MSLTTRNSGKSWSKDIISQLKSLIRQDTPTRIIGLKLGRTPGAVQTEANKLGLSLKPTNQSPYNRRQK